MANNNPTGINQYTKGGARLNPQASRKTIGLGMPKAVIKAAVPHKISVKRIGGVYQINKMGGTAHSMRTAQSTSGALARIREFSRRK